MKAMTANNGNGASVFAQYIDGPKERAADPETIPRGPLLKPIVPPSEPRSPPTEKMLDWLVNRWPGTTVSTRNIMQFGPNCIRDRKSAIATARKLVEHGWLHPIPTRQHRGRAWQIVRGLGSI
jgi:hypothetical protein